MSKKVIKKVAFIVRDPGRSYEALRSCLGTLLEDHKVSYFVLDHEVPIDEAFADNLSLLDEMDGKRYSNHPANVEKHGFSSVSLQEIGELLREQEIIIPY